MIIREVNIPEEQDGGLGTISLRKLDQIVILAGKNGAGKSRILRRLKSYLESDLLDENRHRFDDARRFGLGPVSLTRCGALQRHGTMLPDFSSTITPGDLAVRLLSRYMMPSRLGSTEWVDGFINRVNSHFASVKLDSSNDFDFVTLTPSTLDFTDPSELASKVMWARSQESRACSIDNLPERVVARIQDVQNRWENAHSTNLHAMPDVAEEAKEEYSRLQSIAEALLGTGFDRSIDGEVCLRSRALGRANLSQGERVLLLWTVILHSQVKHLSEAVVVIDEPENHLHPQALLEALDRFTKMHPKVQFWIATHSLPVLAHFDQSSIFWVENGAVEYAGTKPLKVLRGLMGSEDRISELHEFLGLPANLAGNRFAAQCVVAPTVSDRGEGDPQTGQIRKILNELTEIGGLQILDFGAGRGRLVAELGAARNAGSKGLIEYFAYDPSRVYSEELKQRVSEFHGSAEGRVFTDIGELTNATGLGAFDVIVLCNVLHEIPVDQWLELFGEKGRFLDLLKDGAHILLVEDTLLPIGESPHPGGFLVLEGGPLFAFLKCKKKELVTDTSGSNARLVAHLIPTEIARRPTRDALEKALELTVKGSGEAIRRLRSESMQASDPDGQARYRAGREHAFHVHQFTNATLALRAIRGR